MSTDFQMVATTLFGLEEVLAKELLDLGARDIKVGVRNVSFFGDLGFMYKVNISLRTAIRILKPIYKFAARNEDQFYVKLQQFRWEKLIDPSGSIAINSAVNSKHFTTNSHYISLKSKDAIVDYFRDKYDQRPNIDLKHPDLRINIHIKDDRCTVSIDSSGQSLHRRGYRTATNIAPINEVLAAGLVLLSGYTGETDFIDPMCGSGTILIEAAMIANRIPANINRREFAFENWKDFDVDLFDLIHGSLLKKISTSPCKILGFDKAPSAIMKATDNIAQANLSEFISVEKADFFLKDNVLSSPLVLFNPPYGERLKIDPEGFYKNIGDTLKQKYSGSSAWLITSDLEALKNVGLKTSRRIAMKNGDLDCKYVKYDLYNGSKKGKYMNKSNSED